KRFVAGTTIDETVKVIQQLNAQGLCVTVDYLGEFVTSESEALEMTEHAVATVEAFKKNHLNAQLSVKLTSIGLDISDAIVEKHMRMILDAAVKAGVDVNIDMEDHTRLDRTLALFRKLREDYSNVHTVIQAYLYRTLDDLGALDDLKPTLRLVKGAYKEPSNVAFPEKKDVDANYRKMIERQISEGFYTAVASHDDAMIDYTINLANKNAISPDRFEFQMLYGIRTERQLQLAKEGYTMRVYVPYGTDWYGYFMRRLAERPANVWFVLKGIFSK
ncbi:MAG: proline dehydrogenase family protein, partial [Bacilli bacterium]